MRKLCQGSVLCQLSRFPFKQHATPHSLTGNSPAELVFGRPLPTGLDGINTHTCDAQGEEESVPPAEVKQFKKGEPVFIPNFTETPKWIPGVVGQFGKRSYGVVTGNNTQRRHVDHMRRRQCDTETCYPSSSTGSPLLDWPGPSNQPESNSTQDFDQATVVSGVSGQPRKATMCGRVS